MKCDHAPPTDKFLLNSQPPPLLQQTQPESAATRSPQIDIIVISGIFWCAYIVLHTPAREPRGASAILILAFAAVIAGYGVD
jgi:hypothetical protein